MWRLMVNREEAHKECLSRDCHCIKSEDRDSNYHSIIDRIYNDFEARTCENCKYYIVRINARNDNEVHSCTKVSSWEISANFGCNAFERK